MRSEGHTVIHAINRYRSPRYELILEGMIVRVVAGAVVVVSRYSIGYVDTLLHSILDFGQSHPWFMPMWFLILATVAFVMAWLLKWESLVSGSGIPQIEDEIVGEVDECWWRVLLAKLGGSILPLGCSLSLDHEGPSIQLGAMAAKGFSRATRRARTEEKLLITCGVNAGLPAAFNAPIVGILFSLKEVHKHFSPKLPLSSMTTSITSDSISRDVFGLKPVSTFTITHMMPSSTYGHVLFLGIVIGAMGIVYNTTLSKTQGLCEGIPWCLVKILILFMLIGVFSFLYRGVPGEGHALVGELSARDMVLGSLCPLSVVKFCFSVVSFGSDTPGGIFLPLLMLGVIIGSIYYRVAEHMSPSLSGLLVNLIILGIAGYFPIIARAPITRIILINEMTGSFSHLSTLSMISLAAYPVPDMLHCAPVYDQLLHKLLRKQNPDKQATLTSERVLVEGIIFHGSAAEGRKASAIAQSKTCPMVPLVQGDAEFVPRRNTMFLAGDKIMVLCDETFEGQFHKTLQEYC